ncbi:MAG: DUF3073 domain-containing protein [Propionicimonas sp.]
MGRGRAKAKQTKVARDLKYRSYSTDFGSLERELRGDSYEPPSAGSADEQVEDDTEDQYADLASRYADYDEDVRKIG